MPQYRGLINEGSTCYLNSLLQTLFMTPEFRQNVYNYVHDERKIAAADSIPYQLQKLFVNLQMNQKSVYTKGLLKSFQWNEVDSFQQHDVQEFCRVLFEALSLASKGANWIEKMYSGLMESFISCGQHPRSSQEIFMDISLPIKNLQTQKYYQSIQQCLREYLKPENLEDKINCEGCGDKVKVEKGMKLSVLPPILTLQVNRFELNYETMQRQKINSFLYFPEILELWRFMVPYSEIKIKDMPKDLLEKMKLIEKQKSARQTDWGIGGGGLSVQGKKIERKKSFEVEAQKKQTKFYDEQNRDKRQDETKKLSVQQQKIKNMQILKDLKAQKQKKDQKKAQQQKKTQKPVKNQSAPATDDDFLFGSFMDGYDISGKDNNINQYEDIIISNESKKGLSVPKFQKTDAVFLHDEEKFDVNKEYEKNTYVLFSILVHSGGAYGGHYYAYIFNGTDWFCFNDNNVTKVSRQQIRKYGHPTQNSSYGANAYLLFYREASAFKEVAKQGEIKIPQQLLEKVKADKTLLNEPIKVVNQQSHSRYSQIQNSVVLKIKHKGQIQTLVISDRHTETVSSLRKFIETNLKITEQPKNWRLRRYNKSQDTMHQVYDVQQNFNKSLEEVGLRQTCHIGVEIKKDDQQFEEYDPKNILVKLNVWREGLTLLTENYLKPIKIPVREQIKFSEFYSKVQNTLKIKSPIIIKRNFSVGNPFQLFQPSAYADKSLISLRFFNGINLYVEEPTTEPKLKWQKQFEDEKYKCQIKFNNPKEGHEKNMDIFIDTRKTLGELKQRIAEIIGMNIEQFRMKKSQQAVSEMTTYKKRLTDLKFVNIQYLHIEEGRSSKGTVLIRKGVVSVIDDQIQFTLGQELQVQIDNTTSNVADLKCKIAQKYGLIQFNVRIRQFKAHQFGQIFRDSESLLKIKEKSLVWQQLQIEDSKGIQLYMRVFDVMTLQLGPLLSIFVEANGNYEQLSLIIEQQTQIKADKIVVHKSSTNFIDKSLLFECEWIQTKFIGRPIRQEPLFLTYDGEILIVKEAEASYHPKPTQKHQVYESGKPSQKNVKKQTGLKITVVEEKQTEIPQQKQQDFKPQQQSGAEVEGKKQGEQNKQSKQGIEQIK